MLSCAKEPKTFSEASKCPEWREAISKELNSHENLGTWSPATLPEGAKAIETRWVFKIEDDGTKKARLVAKGFQLQTDNNEHLYAPVCRPATLKLLLSLTAKKKWAMRQIDVPTAFLNGELDTEVYIKRPEGIVTDCYVFKLNRALYGLRNSPRCWNDTFTEKMISYGYKRSSYDYCLYY